MNAFIRIILAGPLNVGKTSIRRIFTRVGLNHDSPPTEICEIGDKMIDITTYELIECNRCDLRNVLNRIIVDAIETFLRNEDQQVDPLMDLQLDRSIVEQANLTETNLDIRTNKAILSQTKAESIPSISVNEDFQEFHHRHQQSKIQPLQSSISQIYQQLRSQLQDQPPIIDKQFGKLFDFGGQPIYHITHRPFMSTNSIYVLVFNITQDIDKPVITRDGNAIKMTYFEVMQEWLTSIIGGNTNKEEITATIDGKKSKYLLPIVILVASHGDCVDTEEQRINKYNEFAESLLSRLSMYESNVCRSQIIFNCKDNDLTAATEEDRRRCCSKLHSFINGFAKSLPFMEKKIPLRWYITVALLHLAANNEAIDSYAIDNTIINQVKEIQNVSANEYSFGDFAL